MQIGTNPAGPDPIALCICDARIERDLPPTCHLVQLTKLLGGRHLIENEAHPLGAAEALCRRLSYRGAHFLGPKIQVWGRRLR